MTSDVSSLKHINHFSSERQ